jgi:hypothetical protein
MRWIGWIFSTTLVAMDKKNQLEAMAIAADGLIAFASRHADALEKMAESTSDPTS